MFESKTVNHVKHYCDQCHKEVLEFITTTTKDADSNTEKSSIEYKTKEKMLTAPGLNQWICEDCFNKIPEYIKPLFTECKG